MASVESSTGGSAPSVAHLAATNAGSSNVMSSPSSQINPINKQKQIVQNPPSNNIPLNSLDDEHDEVVAQHSSISGNTSPDSLLSLSFNQDGGCLAVGTTSGFRIYNVFPFQETFRRTFDGSFGANGNMNNNSNETHNEELKNREGSQQSNTNGIGIVEMLFRCNLLALVGGGPSPRYPPNKVMIWDDHRGRCIGELSFRQRVLAVKLRRDRVAVALMDRVYVYNFSDLTLLDQIHTVNNPLGLLSLSPDAGGLYSGAGESVGMVLACPSINRGGVRVELYGCRKTVLIDAHETSLAAIALSLSGTLLATASERGTLIRLFSTKDKNGTLLRELRRGVERAHIYCISFSMENQWLAATSDRGTTHIFYLGEKTSKDEGGSGNGFVHSTNNAGNSNSVQNHNKLSSLLTSPKKFLKSKRILWEGEGSYAQIRGIDDPVVCAFVPDKPMTIAVVGKTDGSILLADFSNGSGEAERVAYHRFIKGSGTGDPMSIGMNNVGEKKDDARNRELGVDFREEDVIFGDEDGADGFVTVQKAG